MIHAREVQPSNRFFAEADSIPRTRRNAGVAHDASYLLCKSAVLRGRRGSEQLTKTISEISKHLALKCSAGPRSTWRRHE